MTEVRSLRRGLIRSLGLVTFAQRFRIALGYCFAAWGRFFRFAFRWGGERPKDAHPQSVQLSTGRVTG